MREQTERELIVLGQMKEYRGRMPLVMELEKATLLRQLCHARLAFTEAQRWAQHAIDIASKEKLATIQNMDELMKVVGLRRGAYMYRARDSFEAFLKAMDWEREPAKRFYEPRISVLKPVVDKMQDLADGKLDVLGISMPPRVGKTTLGLLYICWRAGRQPNKSILSAGYSGSLVNSFYDGCMEFLTSPEYTFLDIFPESPLVSSSAKNLTLDLSERRRYKSLTFRSIDGTVTGATEASELLYLDDLVSGIEEALNINRLDNLWNKVSSDLLQRKKNGVPTLIIGTRWSIYDPLGRIEAKYDGDPRACFMRLPALDDFGKSNFEYDFNVGFDTNHYLNLRSMTDRATWECVYMQNPIERDGLLFTELNRFFDVPHTAPDEKYAWVDVAFGGSDYLSMPIAYRWGDDIYVVDAVFIKGDYKITEPVVAGKIISHSLHRVVFEANNGGDFYARDIMKLLKEQGYTCNITTARAPGNASKLSRIIQHAPAIKEWLFRDVSLYSNEEMYGVMMNQLLSFVQTGKNVHDDAADSLAGLATMTRKIWYQQPTFVDRRAIGL